MNHFLRRFNGYTAFIFQNDYPADALKQYQELAELGDCFAPYYVEFLQAKESKDFHRLAEFIPDNWLDLYNAEYNKFFPDFERIAIDAMINVTLREPEYDNPATESELYQKLALEQNKSPEEVKQITEETIRIAARTKLFLDLYGSVLPKSNDGELLIPSPFMAKFMGVPLDEVTTRVKEILPSFFTFHSRLSKLTTFKN